MAKGGRRTVEIRSDEVRLLDEDGTDLGYVATAQALRMAAERGLQLLQLDQLSSPPRCQLVNAAAHQAQEVRAARLARAATAPPKEIRLRVLTGAADLETRRRSAAALLEAGHRVKIRVEIEPGQRSNPAPARAVLDQLLKALAPLGTLEQKPFSEKGAVAAVLMPR